MSTKEKQAVLLQCLFDEAKGDLRVAMQIAGYSDATPTSSVAKTLSKEIAEATQDYIARCSTVAAFEMGEIIRGSAPLIGLKERMAAAKDILDRGGFAKTEKVEVSSKDPLFILPPKNSKDE